MLFKILSIFSMKKKKVFLSRKCTFVSSVFEGANDVRAGADVSYSYVGIGTYIGESSDLKFCHIGKFSSIGSNVTVCQNDHPTRNFVSTHPAFHRSSHPLMKKLGLNFSGAAEYPECSNKYFEKYRTKIGSDVWIGTGVTIVEGVDIGDGAVIACGAVIANNVEPYAIVGGVPAKLIRYRFAPNEIEQLMRVKWWDRSLNFLSSNAYRFSSVDDFLRYMLNGGD